MFRTHRTHRTGQNIPEYKLILVGDRGVGKTSLLKRLTTGEFEKKYDKTFGVEVTRLMFRTNRGPVRFNVWQVTSGTEDIGGHCDGYYIQGQGAIIMFDVTRRVTYEDVPNLHRDLTRICENIPIVLTGNKVENKDRKVKAKKITFHRKKSMQYFDMSVKASHNVEKPFLYLARKLSGDDALKFVKAPANLQPPAPEAHGLGEQKQHVGPDIQAAATPPLEDQPKRTLGLGDGIVLPMLFVSIVVLFLALLAAAAH